MKSFMMFMFMAVLLVVTGGGTSSYAQEKKMEKFDVPPEPAGGMGAIGKNVKFPEEAKKNNVQGKVLVNATIDKTGKVTKAAISQGIGSGCDEAAIKAIKKTKFKPAVKDGKKIECEVTIPIEFKLEK